MHQLRHGADEAAGGLRQNGRPCRRRKVDTIRTAELVLLISKEDLLRVATSIPAHHPTPLHAGLWQANMWAVPDVVGAGNTRMQGSSANGQRGWNSQPGGRLNRLGTSPSMFSRACTASGSGTGLAESSAAV